MGFEKLSTEQDPLLRGIPKVRAGDGIVVLGAPVGYAGFVKEKLERRESARYSSAAPPTQGPPFRVCAAEIPRFIA